MNESKYISELSAFREFETSGQTDMTTLTVKYSSNVSLDDLLYALRRFEPSLFADKPEDDECDVLPSAERIVFNAPATVMIWADGTKTVSKARGGDKYDPLFGLLACIFRKLTCNRGHAVDALEDTIQELAASIKSPEDIDALIDFQVLLLDALTVLRCSSDEWLPQLGEQEEDKNDDRPKTAVELQDLAEDIVRTQEEIRQMVRNLTLDGEL